MRFNIKSLIYLPLIFFFVPAFSFYFPGTKAIYNFYYVSLMASVALMFVFDYKYMIRKIRLICTKTPLIYFIIFFIVVCLTSFIAVILGLTTIKQTLFSLLLRYVFAIFPILIYYICLIGKYISYKNFIKYFIFMFWLNAVAGVIAYIGRWFDITFINSIFDFFNNRRILSSMIKGFEEGTANTYFQSHRLTGLFEEPGFLGQFLYIFLPFAYAFSNTSLNLYKNKKLNKIISSMTVPFVWINIVLTLSPITLVFSTMITLIYYFTNILTFIKKYFLFLITMPLFLYLILFYEVLHIDLSESYIARIINIIISIHSFDDFVNIEPSLATRVSSYINELYLFFKHPFIGIGIGNIKSYIYDQYLQSPVPLTPEMIERTLMTINFHLEPRHMQGFIYTLLAEHGIFAVCIYIYFYYKLFISVLKIKTTQLYLYCLKKSLIISLICLLVLWIYELNIISIYLNLVIAMSCVYLYVNKVQRLYGRINNDRR